MKWATRAGCHIDRVACAWLIRRFIDPAATFVFVDDPEEVPADATPFDIRGAALSHHGGGCTFETFLARYDLRDPCLVELGGIVHEADLADERYDAPEAAGIDALVRGLALLNPDDALLAVTAPLFDALCAFLRARRAVTGHPGMVS